MIFPDGSDGFPVYCEMNIGGGGWTVSNLHPHYMYQSICSVIIQEVSEDTLCQTGLYKSNLLKKFKYFL